MRVMQTEPKKRCKIAPISQYVNLGLRRFYEILQRKKIYHVTKIGLKLLTKSIFIGNKYDDNLRLQAISRDSG